MKRLCLASSSYLERRWTTLHASRQYRKRSFRTRSSGYARRHSRMRHVCSTTSPHFRRHSGATKGSPFGASVGTPGLCSRIPRQMGRLALLTRDETCQAPLGTQASIAWAPKSAFAKVQPQSEWLQVLSESLETCKYVLWLPRDVSIINVLRLP